ncbi:phage tail tape measure protein [Roseibium sediminis]|uniref:phage tail tape measure protein n=1 Tax=Roseibium sediminis TaxID=1775174 RepID=UPI00123CC3E6|nr:phage tail tape measure protein [Roseibium sediminis]
MIEDNDRGQPLADLADLQRQMAELNLSARDFSSTLSKGMKSALVDGKSLDSVFRQMALSLSSKVLAKSLAPLEGLAGSLAGNLFSGLGGIGKGLFPSILKSITPFAKGGVVATPTYFSMQGGTGLAGEAGAEAILPLSRGADGRLGVRTGTGNAGNAINVTVVARDVESFRRSEAQVSAIVARAVGRGRRGL